MNRNSRPLKHGRYDLTGSEYRERRRRKQGVIKQRKADHLLREAGDKPGSLLLAQINRMLPRWAKFRK
jgi:hypothetical protein